MKTNTSFLPFLISILTSFLVFKTINETIFIISLLILIQVFLVAKKKIVYNYLFYITHTISLLYAYLIQNQSNFITGDYWKYKDQLYYFSFLKYHSLNEFNLFELFLGNYFTKLFFYYYSIILDWFAVDLTNLISVYPFVLISSFYTIIIYKTIKIYNNSFDIVKSEKFYLFVSILFSLFSHNFTYSGFLLRDCFINIISIFVIYFILKEKKSFLKILILILLTSFFRVANGVVLLFFYFLVYNYKDISFSRKGLFRLFILSIPFVFFFSTGVGQIAFNYSLKIINGFNEKVFETSDASSLGLKLQSSLIGHILLTFYSMIDPFPYIKVISNEGFKGFHFILSSLGLFYYLTIIGANFIKRKLDKLDIFLVAFVFIISFISTYATFNPRRIMFLYPLLYVVFSKQISSYKINYSYKSLEFIIIMILLISLYSILKFL